MASSTFRGRRVVDPIPLQRGPLPRDRKYPSSFSDLAAAWENVGEVKSALQDAEARINEANAGLGSEVEQNGEVDVSLQEVFSERQRYGRVARYELRPSRFGQAASSVPSFGEDQLNSRRVPDFPLSINRPSESSTRAPVHTPLLSPPSKDIHDKVPNGRFSRNSVPSYSAHPPESEMRDPGVATAYSSLYTANDPLGRRPPIRLYGNTLSTIPSASSFEDSLEIGESSSRVHQNEACSTSSLGLRPTIANNSGNGSSNPSPPPEQRPSVQSVDSTTAADSYRADVDVPVRTAGVISKRKVASAPAAPAYKGFSEVESKTTVLSEVNRKVKRKDPATHKLITKPANQRPQKPITKKGPPKVQRVIAPRRPTDIITTSSWRSGQQTVKRILGPAKKKSSSPEGSRPQSRSSQGSDISEPKSLNFQWRDEGDGKKHAGVGNGSEKGGALTDEVPRVTSPTNQKLVNGLKKDSGSDSELSWVHSSGHAKESVRDAEKDVKDLKGNKILSTEAKNILSDLELDTDDESDKEMKKPVAGPKPKQTRVNKPSSTSRRKRPLNSQSQGPPMSSYPPRQKVRHYDTDEVKVCVSQISQGAKKV
ncbi:unnamed protein product, partial [Porites evermanni]